VGVNCVKVYNGFQKRELVGGSFETSDPGGLVVFACTPHSAMMIGFTVIPQGGKMALGMLN